MKKKYYRLCYVNRKPQYVESYGIVLTRQLSDQNTMVLALECIKDQYNHREWILTDVSTGLKAQNQVLKTRAEAINYISDLAILSKLDAITQQQFYKNYQKAMLDFLIENGEKL